MEVYFKVNVGRKFRAQAGVHQMEGVRLIQVSLYISLGFTSTRAKLHHVL